MPLTMRELEARRRRAAEGYARFRAPSERINTECSRRLLRDGPVSMYDKDAAFRRLAHEAAEEIALAVEMIREGLPHTLYKVRIRFLKCLKPL